MSDEDIKTELERLLREGTASVRMKVSEKGAVSIYGRFPVTLYKEQWLNAGYVRGDSFLHC